MRLKGFYVGGKLKKQKDFKRIFNSLEGIPSRGSKMGPSITVQSSRAVEGLSKRGQPRRRESSVVVRTHPCKGGVVVIILNGYNPMHVPMNLHARTSALDLFLDMIKWT